MPRDPNDGLIRATNDNTRALKDIHGVLKVLNDNFVASIRKESDLKSMSAPLPHRQEGRKLPVELLVKNNTLAVTPQVVGAATLSSDGYFHLTIDGGLLMQHVDKLDQLEQLLGFGVSLTYRAPDGG